MNYFKVRFYDDNAGYEIGMSAEGYGIVDGILLEFYSDGRTIATFLLSKVCVRLITTFDDDAEPVEDFDE